MKCILQDPDIAQKITDRADKENALYTHDAIVKNQKTDPPVRSYHETNEQWNLADDKVDIECGNKESTGKESHVTKTKNKSSTIGVQVAPKASGPGGGAELVSISGSRTCGKSQIQFDKHHQLLEQHFGANRELSPGRQAKITTEVVTETHSCEVKDITVDVEWFKKCSDKISFMIKYIYKDRSGREIEHKELRKNKPIKKYFKDSQESVATFDGTYTWKSITHKTICE